MARCQWCGTVSRDVERLTNGRSELLLCPMCVAQKEVLQQSTLRPHDLGRSSVWDRLRRMFGDR